MSNNPFSVRSSAQPLTQPQPQPGVPRAEPELAGSGPPPPSYLKQQQTPDPVRIHKQTGLRMCSPVRLPPSSSSSSSLALPLRPSGADEVRAPISSQQDGKAGVGAHQVAGGKAADIMPGATSAQARALMQLVDNECETLGMVTRVPISFQMTQAGKPGDLMEAARKTLTTKMAALARSDTAQAAGGPAFALEFMKAAQRHFDQSAWLPAGPGTPATSTLDMATSALFKVCQEVFKLSPVTLLNDLLVYGTAVRPLVAAALRAQSPATAVDSKTVGMVVEQIASQGRAAGKSDEWVRQALSGLADHLGAHLDYAEHKLNMAQFGREQQTLSLFSFFDTSDDTDAEIERRSQAYKDATKAYSQMRDHICLGAGDFSPTTIEQTVKQATARHERCFVNEATQFADSATPLIRSALAAPGATREQVAAVVAGLRNGAFEVFTAPAERQALVKALSGANDAALAGITMDAQERLVWRGTLNATAAHGQLVAPQQPPAAQVGGAQSSSSVSTLR